jgi:hypothetical protein
MKLRAQLLSGDAYIPLTYFTSRIPHCLKLGVWRELRDGLGEVLVERVAALLADLTVVVAVTAIESWLFHVESFQERIIGFEKN